MKKLFFIIFFLLFASNVSAQTQQDIKPFEKKHEGIVIEIIEDEMIEVTPGIKQPYQKVKLEITNSDLKGKKVIAELGGMFVSNENLKVKPGDKIIINHLKKVDGSDQFYVGDFIRRTSLYFLAFVFILAVIIVGGIRGFTSFIGLIISFVILLKYIIPQIVAGGNPIFIAIS